MKIPPVILVLFVSIPLYHSFFCLSILGRWHKQDFIAKMNISLKEASETEYWLELLRETGFLSDKEFEGIYNDCQEILKIIISIVKNSKKQL